jgi:hypothetical protein
MTPNTTHRSHRVCSRHVTAPRVSTAVGTAPSTPRSAVANALVCPPRSLRGFSRAALFHEAQVVPVSGSTTSPIHSTHASKSSLRGGTAKGVVCVGG